MTMSASIIIRSLSRVVIPIPTKPHMRRSLTRIGRDFGDEAKQDTQFIIDSIEKKYE